MWDTASFFFLTSSRGVHAPQRSGNETRQMTTCVMFVTWSLSCLRTLSCARLAACRALGGAHTPLVESSSHRNLRQFPLSDPRHTYSTSHTSPTSSSHTYQIRNQPPPRPARLCFQKEAILLLKSPLLEDERFKFQWLSTVKSSTHSIIQSITAPLAIREGEERNSETDLLWSFCLYVCSWASIADY